MTRRSKRRFDDNERGEPVSPKRTTVELESDLRAAEQRLRLRDEFLRLAGHELRSPLTAAQLHADTLTMLARHGATAEQIQERCERVKRSVHRLAWLVDEVVDLGRASGLGLALHLGQVDLVQLARRVLDRFADELGQAGCEVRLAAPATVLATCDAARMEHALGSLLLMAMRSGGGGAIDLEIGGDGVGARLSMRDGGQGLPAAESALVFATFDRLLAGLTPGSLALALWLVRAVAEAHGGRLELGPGLASIEWPQAAVPGSI